ncbi:DedA family protein [Serratia sp. M24T3]|uniref:Inner membrane protein YghB n=1 Tax=Rouxiella sp. WC2420 TaxID=3234145 RepID=A0AB39VSK1_9GAMM|nr:DedA family protein [Serratia sp. M24T3]EIC82264.1 hypothetical protein SPM24T3_22676 [Serratia sp. M24T3]
MAVFTQILHALWQHDFSVLANPNVLWVVYAVLFTTLLLENGLLPASFLPGDSLLLLTGALVAKGVMSMLPTLIILVVASSLGCWLSYLQGRWLGHTRIVKGWLLHLPAHYHERAHILFTKHGLAALLAGRFLAFVRTLLPTIAGISGLDNARFQLFNWLSALLWVGVIMGMGYALCQIPLVQRHEDKVMAGLMILPALLLVTGLAGALLVIWKNRRKIAS